MIGFELLLFYADPVDASAAAAAGIDGLVVDWERRGKELRQRGADTEINAHTIDDLRRARAATGARVVCRTDGVEGGVQDQLEAAIEAGADEVILPMVRGPVEVEMAIDHVGGRIGVGILVETTAAIETADELAALPLSRAYVGLNDLAIERGSDSIFDAIADGTVNRLAQTFTTRFGFGGLTLPECGDPIPCWLLIAEMDRVGATFSFLRRSYRRDLRRRGGHGEAVESIRAALRASRGRDETAVRRDHEELLRSIAGAAPRLRVS
jgi:hypothetical protein